MQRVSIEEVLQSTPDNIRDILREIGVQSSGNHQENVKTLLSLYAGFNMLSPEEKIVVNKSVKKTIKQFHIDMDLYLAAGSIAEEFGLFHHIQDFMAGLKYRFQLDSGNEYINIYDNETDQLLQKLDAGVTPHRNRKFQEIFLEYYVYQDGYLYIESFDHGKNHNEIRQYHNEGTVDTPNFVFTGKVFDDIITEDPTNTLISMTVEGEYLVLKYDSGITNYVDPFSMKLIKQT